jgi:hypothetical protein
MTINSNDATVQQPLCYEIYTFTKGASIIRLTSHNSNMTVDGELYRAAPISRSNIKYQLGSVITPCQIKIPIDYIYTILSGVSPVSPIMVEIRRYYLGDTTDYHLILAGIMVGWIQSGREIEITCLNRGYELKTQLPRKYYQALCNHQLFDAGCTLDKEDYKMRVTISRYDNVDAGVDIGAGSAYLEVADFSPDSFGQNFSDFVTTEFGGHFAQGYIEYGGYRYLIANHKPATLQPAWIETQYRIPFPAGASRFVVTIYPGCGRTPHQCLDSYSNLTNFLGFWYMPANNPADKGLNI